MFRLLIALVLGFSVCFGSLSLQGRERDRKGRDGDRAAKRDGDRREARNKRERKQPKKRQHRRPKETQPEKRTKKPQPRPDQPRAQEKPAPDEPEKAEPTPSEPKPETPAEPTPAEPLPKPAERVAPAEPKAVEGEPADSDFALQGEYLGNLTSGPLAGRAGLQVVALGDGKFDAYLLQGGLPGNGWLRRSPRPKLTGERNGSQLVLRGEHGSIELDGAVAKVIDAEGHSLGSLKKVLRRSPTQGAAPAVGAKVLFDGSSTEAFQRAKLTDDGLLGVEALTKEPVGDFRMHLEFRTPFEPSKRGQGRGNSGIYIQERYEVQVLDSFGLAGDASECGGLYRQRKPDFNLCLPPLSWQTYDIRFTAARFDAQGNKVAHARITVFHNGIAIHNNVELTDKTGAGQKEEPTPRPIRFQEHGNAVVYRNIWLVSGQGRSQSGDSSCCEP